MNKILGRLYCFIGHHDDLSITNSEGHAWKLYCRRCERVIFDYKARERERCEKERREIKAILEAEQKPVIDIMPSGSERLKGVPNYREE